MGRKKVVLKAKLLYRCCIKELVFIFIFIFWVFALHPVFVETMIQVAERFTGASGVERVILSLPSRISEAMLTMMENIQTINSKVRRQ